MLRLPIQEYFKYHPPTTEERKRLHNSANELTLKLCLDLDRVYGDAANGYEPIPRNELDEMSDQLTLSFTGLTSDQDCLNWASHSLDTMFISLNSQGFGSTEILMYCEQIRMFLNQGITIDDVVVQRSQ